MRKVAWGLAAIAVSAVLLVLALPPADVGPMGFVCLVPVLCFVRGKGLAVGFASGMAVLLLSAFITAAGWFYTPSLLGEDPGWNYTGFALFGLAVGGDCAIAGESRSPRPWAPWVWAAWAVLFEAALLVYLPAHLALTQYRSFPALRLASVGGIWAVSYLVWVVNLLMTEAIRNRKFASLASYGAFLGLFIGIGVLTGHVKPSAHTVAAVQTQSADISDLTALNTYASELGARVVVWPELGGVAAAPRGDTSALVALASHQEQSPFVTSFEDDASPLPHNAAAVFSRRGESKRYWKRKPFGGERNVHAAGDKPASVRLDSATCGLNICFDSCFPSVMRETALQNGVNLILLPTQDPVAPYGTIQALHAAYTPFRAAENGVPIVRADITAYSMVVDSRGVIVAELGSGVQSVLTANVDPDRRDTLYRRFGDWFLYVAAVLAALGATTRVKAHRSSQTE